MKNPKIYIAGKVTGLDIDQVRSKFAKAQDELLAQGYHVVNPTKLYTGNDWDEAMNVCLKALRECEAIYMLSDWEDSKGAKIEYNLAQQMGIMILHQSVDTGHPANAQLQNKYNKWLREN